MPDALDLADKLWRGEIAIEDQHPISFTGDLVEIADGIAFVPSFANVSAFQTRDGLVLVDTGSPMFASTVFDQIRGWSQARLSTAIYTHGHIDHVFGIGPFEDEARARGWDLPRVVAHENVAARFDRYVLTSGYNGVINQRQFQVPGLEWPTEYRYPDVTYRKSLTLAIGGRTFELHHGKGETDDHTWVWAPDGNVLCCGDFVIWACPNAGNPQKAQRYPREWAAALRAMNELDAEVLLPGHGLPVVGADRVRSVLDDTASLLESIVEQTLDAINSGARLDDVIAAVEPPDELLAKPYLRAIYDEPEFIVRNLWRLYAGWYDGNPARLKPARDADVAREVTDLAGGSAALVSRARELAARGELRLAGEIIELAWLGDPADPHVNDARVELYELRATSEASTMARGIFASAAAESRSGTGAS